MFLLPHSYPFFSSSSKQEQNINPIKPKPLRAVFLFKVRMPALWGTEKSLSQEDHPISLQILKPECLHTRETALKMCPCLIQNKRTSAQPHQSAEDQCFLCWGSGGLILFDHYLLSAWPIKFIRCLLVYYSYTIKHNLTHPISKGKIGSVESLLSGH